MKNKLISFLQIIRAPFFSSILAPLLTGTVIAVIASQHFYALNFFFVLVMGLGLHAATNVYNDIYDTLQGTDRVNENRNDFSGGSGLLVENPDLLGTMVHIARMSLVGAAVAALILFFLVDSPHKGMILVLYALSAFFAKYYTAAPVKLSYRGLGEISVWFAFGPMAVLLAAAGQNSSFHPFIIAAMPATGLSTTSILLIGELIDLPADAHGGKHGFAVRYGSRKTAVLYAAVQITIMLNMVLLAVMLPHGWPFVLVLIPFVFILPRIFRILFAAHNQPVLLVPAAGLNVKLHMMFSLLYLFAALFTLAL